MCSWVVRKVVKIKRSMLGCQPRSVCLGGCVLVKSILYILYTISRFRSVARNFDRYGICMKYQRRWYKICLRGLCGKLFKIEDQF